MTIFGILAVLFICAIVLNARFFAVASWLDRELDDAEAEEWERQFGPNAKKE